MELLDEEKERFAREYGHDLESSACWQAHFVQILKEHGFVQGLSNHALFVHVERDVRLLVHGDDVMVEMPTDEEKWFECVLFSKYDGKCTGQLQSDGNTAMEASLLNRVIRWGPTPGSAELEADTRHVAMVLRDLGLEKSTPVVTPVAKRPMSEELLLLAGVKPFERRGNHVAQLSHDTRELLVSGPSRLVIRCRISGTTRPIMPKSARFRQAWHRGTDCLPIAISARRVRERHIETT